MSRPKKRLADQMGVLAGQLTSDAMKVVSRVVLVRESDAGGKLLFFEMIYKTVKAHEADHPEYAQLLDIGLDVFDNPDRYRAVVLGDAKARTAMFMLGDSLVMYHMGSAALDTPESASVALRVLDDGTSAAPTQSNRFTEHLLEVLKKYRPQTVLVYGINRLVRDLDNAGYLAETLRELRITVRTATEVFDLNRSHDALVWGILVNFAAAERDGIVERNTLGRIAAARRNDWPHRVEHVPFGYKLVGPTITPDPAQFDAVREMLVLLANPDLSAREFAERVGALGLSRPRMQRIHGEATTVASALHPKDLVRSITNWLPLYETGVYRFQLPCPTKTGELFGGLPVFHVAPNLDDGATQVAGRYVMLSYTYGLPAQGWALPSVFEAIRQKHLSNRKFTSRVVGRRRPFAALPRYIYDNQVLQIDSNTANGYRLRRVTYLNDEVTNHSVAGTTTVARNVPHTATTIATVALALLHASVAQGIIDQLSCLIGVEGEIRQDLLGRFNAHDEQRKLLEQRLNRLEQEQLRAAENAASLSGSGTSSGIDTFVTVVNNKQLEIDAVKAELEACINDIPTSPSSVVTKASFVAAFAQLSTTCDAVDHHVAVALRNLIPRFELYPSSSPGVLCWSADVRIPLADNKALQLGPITGVIHTRSAPGHKIVRKRRVSPPNLERDNQAVLDLWVQGASVDAISNHRGHPPKRIAKIINSRLKAGGFTINSSSVLRTAFAPQTRQVVLNAANANIPAWIINNAPTLDEIADRLSNDRIAPEGCTLEWATHMIVTYTFGVRTEVSQRMAMAAGSKYIAALHSVLNGQDTLGELCHVIADTGDALSHYQHSARFLDQPNSPLRHCEPWDAHVSGMVTTNRYQPHPCPQCAQPMTIYRPVPEVEGAMLCAHCRISQAPNSPIYPQAYVQPDQQFEPSGPKRKARSRNKPVFTATQIAAIVNDYNAGTPALKILARHGINNHDLYEILTTTGTEKRHPTHRRR